MCDDLTEADNEKWAGSGKLARRDFAAAGASAAALVLMSGTAAVAAGTSAKQAITSRKVTIKTKDGTADAFFVYPKKGKHPAVIMWPDIAGLRPAYETMGSRLAEDGYAVLVVNQYYRSAPAPILNTISEWRTEAGAAKLKPMIPLVTPAGTISDAAGFVAWLDKQAEVDTARKIGTCGYCMGGPFTFRTAAASPSRVGALGSFHGGGLATDSPDSPHLLIAKFKAAMLIAIAQNDDERDPTAKVKLHDAATAVSRPAEIEVYPAQHGWCTLDAPVYDQVQADKAWGRMLATFKQYL